MAYIGPVFRWDLFWADLEPSVGTEQAGLSRPVLVVSNDGANRTFRSATVVPLTKLEGKRRGLRSWEILLPRGVVPNDFTPLALPFQVRTISILRLLARIGRLEDPAAQRDVEIGLLRHLAIPAIFPTLADASGSAADAAEAPGGDT